MPLWQRAEPGCYRGIILKKGQKHLTCFLGMEPFAMLCLPRDAIPQCIRMPVTIASKMSRDASCEHEPVEGYEGSSCLLLTGADMWNRLHTYVAGGSCGGARRLPPMHPCVAHGCSPSLPHPPQSVGGPGEKPPPPPSPSRCGAQPAACRRPAGAQWPAAWLRPEGRPRRGPPKVGALTRQPPRRGRPSGREPCREWLRLACPPARPRPHRRGGYCIHPARC